MLLPPSLGFDRSCFHRSIDYRLAAKDTRSLDCQECSLAHPRPHRRPSVRVAVAPAYRVWSCVGRWSSGRDHCDQPPERTPLPGQGPDHFPARGAHADWGRTRPGRPCDSLLTRSSPCVSCGRAGLLVVASSSLSFLLSSTSSSAPPLSPARRRRDGDTRRRCTEAGLRIRRSRPGRLLRGAGQTRRRVRPQTDERQGERGRARERGNPMCPLGVRASMLAKHRRRQCVFFGPTCDVWPIGAPATLLGTLVEQHAPGIQGRIGSSDTHMTNDWHRPFSSANRPCLLVFAACCFCVSSSYGSVYKALDKRDGKLVAIKVLEVENEDTVELQKEINILKECDCEWIVRYKGSYRKDGNIWIVMEVRLQTRPAQQTRRITLCCCPVSDSSFFFRPPSFAAPARCAT